METKSRIYRYFSTITAFMFFGVIIFPFFAYMSSLNTNGNGIALFLIGLSVLSLYGTLSSTYSVTVTEEEIIAKFLWRRNILIWGDLDKIIPKSNGSFSLLNRDGSTKVFISSQFKAYIELVNFINQKRPDLFYFDHDNHFSRTIIRNILVTITGFLVVGFAGLVVYLILIGKGSLLLNGNVILLIGLGIYFLRGWSYSPQSFKLEDNTLIANYLYKKVSYSVNDISFIKLALIGNSYSVLVILKTKRLIKVSGFQQGPFVTYFVLLQWYQKYASEQPSLSS